MLSNWTPRSPANGQRKNPGIYSASDARPKRSALGSVDESSKWPGTWSNLDKLVATMSGGTTNRSECSETSSSLRSDRGILSFRPANETPERSRCAYRPHSESDLSLQEIAGSGTKQGSGMDHGWVQHGSRKHYDHDVTATLLNDFDARQNLELKFREAAGNTSPPPPPRWSPPPPRVEMNYSTPYLPGPPACNQRDTSPPPLPRWSPSIPRVEMNYSTPYPPGRPDCSPRDMRSPTVKPSPFSCPVKPRDVAYNLPEYSAPLVEEWKVSKYSDTESPSTIAGASSDSHENSSDSDAQPIRRGFNSEDSPDGSSDSDLPASSESEHPPSPELPSVEVATSDESEAEPHTARMSEPASEKSQSRHPLAVIGWVGGLPLDESFDNVPSAHISEPGNELLSPKPLPKRHHNCERARGTTQNAKGLSIALDSELRSLEDEMSDLTRDLLAIKRSIPPSFSSKNADDKKCCD